MAYDIGTARGVIELDYNGRGIDEAQQDLAGLEKQGGKSSQMLAGVGKTATRAGLVVAAGLGAGVYAAANFEQRLSAIQAVSGATGAEMDRISAKALQLGKDTAFSASESAQAMEELVKAGLTVDEVLNGAADATVALAAAGEVDMPTAATIASNAMNQFNLNAEDMVGVVDNIAGAANASAIDVNDFGMSLSQVGAVANLVGLSFDDTAQAIALMGNAGIKGSDAGTSLKTMLNNLQPTTKKQKDLFKDLGIVTEEAGNRFYDAEGNIKSMAQIAGVLGGALKGMSKQQKQAALETMFGSDAIRAAAVIADSGSKGFEKMGKAMGKVTAAEVAATRMDNFKGSLEEMKGSLETAGIALGTILLPPLRQLVDAVTKALNWFLNLSDAQKKWVVGIVAGVAGLLLLIGAIIKIVFAVQKVIAALKLIRAAMAVTWVAALGPIALIIAAIAAVVAIIVLLWKKSETFRNIVLGVWDAIKDAARAVADWFMGSLLPALQSVWDGIIDGLTWVKDLFVTVWNAIKTAVTTAWNFIITVVTTYINILRTIITTVLNVIKGIWTTVWNTFGPLLKAVWGLIVAIVRLGWTIVKGLFLLWLGVIKTIFGTAWRAIVAVLRGVWNVIVSVIRTGVNIARAVITAVWNAIKAVTSAVWNGIKAVISAVWGVIGGTVMKAVNRVKDLITTAWDAIKSVTSRIWDALVEVVKGAIDRVVDAAGNIKDRVLGFFSGAGGWLLQAGKDIIQGLIDGITDMIGNLTDKIGDVTSVIGRFLPGSPVKEGPLKVLNRGYAGKQIMGMVIDGIEKMSPALNAAMGAAMPTAVPTTVPVVPVGATREPTSAGETKAPGALRLVDGELRLDRSGRAFIRGLAVEVVEESDDFDDVLSRMR